jgi:hypothetical protein
MARFSPEGIGGSGFKFSTQCMRFVSVSECGFCRAGIGLTKGCTCALSRSSSALGIQESRNDVGGANEGWDKRGSLSPLAAICRQCHVCGRWSISWCP